MPTPSFGDYIVYADESGGPGLTTIDPLYPMFVLAFCIFRKDEYANSACPQIQEFKFRHFGEDTVVLHERDIRKSQNRFSIFSEKTRPAFVGEVCELVSRIPFTLVAVAIRKDLHKAKYSDPANPYEFALEMGLERVSQHLLSLGQAGKLTHVIFECRGAKEDRDIELEFRRVASDNSKCNPVPLSIVMCDKRGNSAGLQVADLVAGPIGAKVLRPDDRQRAYDLIKEKFRKSPSGKIEGWGLKVFPPGSFAGLE
jgi:hypothetical protein